MAVGNGRSERGIELTLDIWHPQCWTLHVTEDTDADFLGHGLYTTKNTVHGLFTAAAQSIFEVDRTITEIQDSVLTDDVWTMSGQDGVDGPATAGTATRGFLGEWGVDTGENIVDSLVDHGFVPRRTYQMTDGREQWSVVTTMDRHEAHEQLGDVSSETDADIDIRRVTSNGRQPGRNCMHSRGQSQRPPPRGLVYRNVIYFGTCHSSSSPNLTVREETNFGHCRSHEAAVRRNRYSGRQ